MVRVHVRGVFDASDAMSGAGDIPRLKSLDLRLVSYRYRPDQAWGWPGGRYDGWTTGFIEAVSTDGAVGIGEVGDGLNCPELLDPIVSKLAGWFEGEPVDPECVVNSVHARAPGWGTGGLVASVVSGVEIALVDLLGIHLGVPARSLFGYDADLTAELDAYASGGIGSDLGELRLQVRSYAEQGYRAVKIRIGLGHDEDVRRVEAARDVLGDDARLMVDYGASYLIEPPSVSEMVRLASSLEEFDLAWLEDPLPRLDVDGMAALRSETSIPIASGENERELANVHRLLEAEAIDVLQTDAVYVGGISQQLELGRMAYEAGVRLAPHTWGSGPSLMANATTVACSPAGMIVEVPQVPNPLREGTLRQPLVVSDGAIRLPDSPGLGVHLPDELRRQRFDPAALPRLAASE